MGRHGHGDGHGDGHWRRDPGWRERGCLGVTAGPVTGARRRVWSVPAGHVFSFPWREMRDALESFSSIPYLARKSGENALFPGKGRAGVQVTGEGRAELASGFAVPGRAGQECCRTPGLGSIGVVGNVHNRSFALRPLQYSKGSCRAFCC